MESHLGFDLSQVRVHTDARAAEAAKAVDAQAFTVGHEVAFAAGQWAPHTAAGSRLLAHELTHVVQQSRSDGVTAGSLQVSAPHDPAEREAEEVALSLGQRWSAQVAPAAREHLARQQVDDKPKLRAPVLNPADPRLRDIIEGLDPPGPGRDRSTLDPHCQSAVAESPPWMPNLRRRSPIELGEGTRRHPKLKEPGGQAGAKCRGACGPDCPDTCKTVGTYAEEYVVGSCGYVVEFPNALLCGTHAGCRSHDACFDIAEANGETLLFGPRHNQCNQDAIREWGAKTKRWMVGDGPYDAWWYFVDDPIIRKSWRVKAPTAAPSRP